MAPQGCAHVCVDCFPEHESSLLEEILGTHCWWRDYKVLVAGLGKDRGRLREAVPLICRIKGTAKLLLEKPIRLPQLVHLMLELHDRRLLAHAVGFRGLTVPLFSGFAYFFAC